MELDEGRETAELELAALSSAKALAGVALPAVVLNGEQGHAG